MPFTALHALRSRDLRLYFFGQGISLIGTWMSTIASTWLVYRMIPSEFLLGLVGFCAQFPSALCGPLAGVYVDRWDKRKVLLCTQALSMVQSTVLAFLTLAHLVTVPQIILLNLVQALINAFDLPARQSFLSEILRDREDLPNAIALNAAMFHGSRLIGPAIAGIMVASAGEGICFVVDAVSYAAVLLSLLWITNRTPRAVESHTTWYASLLNGFRYARRVDVVRITLLLVAAVSLFGTPHIALLPVFARDVFGGGPDLYGYLAASSGFGAFSGAMFLASLPRGGTLKLIVARMPLLQGAALVLLALANTALLGGVALYLAGFAMVATFAGANSILQMAVEDSKRARVLSLFSASFFGLMPICGLVAGALAHRLGAQAVVLWAGIIVLGIGGYTASKSSPKIS